ncbi:putative The ARF like 2 binding protein BART [Trypanosoma vivax]|uniref:BART domain-containing protein n=1 Tax=Trypanosoma vivax (strain Y486) TaxID=1055687 RepID=G0U2X7_TRYVY|nr:hypothetical protein TRVL_00889 [Trypanosoma vivax]KAH8604215.1 putative The ARF like 2 binding protein BART [Trypanosoma vivax]CCC50631.1 conserved hypothetical protein [Trypanosoma vivax Y486]
MHNDVLLERLDAFFSEGVNTDAVGGFFSDEYDLISRLHCPSDSSEALELYDAFKRYHALIEGVLQAFLDQEAESNPVNKEDLALAVMREAQKEQDSCQYLCVAYIAGALDFDSFKELVADVVAMTVYPVGDELSSGVASGDVGEDATKSSSSEAGSASDE